MINDEVERRVDVANLATKVELQSKILDIQSKLLDQLSLDARFNNRFAIIAVCVIAAGKEILNAFK
jgi:hypothetical protein